MLDEHTVKPAQRAAVIKALDAQIAPEAKPRPPIVPLASAVALAPDIVKAIAQGRQPQDLTARRLMTTDLPMDWAEQRQQLAFT